jgi:hypothetical protein
MSHILYLRLHAKDPMTFSVSEESLHMPTLEERKEIAEQFLAQYIYDGRDGRYFPREDCYIDSKFQQLILTLGAKREHFEPSEDMPAVIEALERTHRVHPTLLTSRELDLANKIKSKVLENRVNPLLDKFPSFAEFTFDDLRVIETKLPHNARLFLRNNRDELAAHFGEPTTKEQVFNATNMLLFANLYFRSRLCANRTISASARTTLISFIRNSGVDIDSSPIKETLGWGITALDARRLFLQTVQTRPRSKFLLAGCLSPQSVDLYNA